MLRYVLVFLAGALVGANVVYFLAIGRGSDSDAALVFQRERTQHTLPADPAAADPTDTIVTPAPGTPARADAGIPQERDGSPAPMPPSPAPQGDRATPPRPPATPVDDAVTPPTHSGLIVPVRGVAPARLSNTFDDARGQGRVHEAVDIMAPRGTPVVAVADGTVEKLFTSEPGGLTIYQFEPTGRRAYYYAHLDRYAAGLAEGDRLQQGQVIGYVGSTGNASEDAPHLHFAIFRLGPEKRWWEGTAINPYPILTGRQEL